MAIGPEGTRLSLGDDLLGTWANEAIRFSADPDLSLTIAGETWLIFVEEPDGFRPVAEAHYAPPEAERPDELPTGTVPDEHADDAFDELATPEIAPETDDVTLVEEGPPRARRGKGEIPWQTLAPTVGAPTAMIATLVSGALLAVAMSLEGPLSTLSGFVSGVAAFAAALSWRGFVAHRRALRRPTGGPDVDAEARVARAVARALTARTVTASLEGRAAHELTMIKGIGPQYAQLLAEVGIQSIEDLANVTDRQRSQLEGLLGRHGERVERERWVEQAKKIVQTRRSSHAFR